MTDPIVITVANSTSWFDVFMVVALGLSVVALVRRIEKLEDFVRRHRSKQGDKS